MRILYVQYGNPWNPFSHGGLAHAGHQICRRLAKRHDMEILTGLILQNREALKSKTADNVFYQSCSMSKNRYLNRLAFSKKSLSHDYDPFDVIVVPWDRYAPFINLHVQKPLVLEIHQDYFNAPSKLALIEPLCRLLFQRVLRRYPNAVAVSETLLHFLEEMRLRPKNAAVIYNGTDDELFIEPDGPVNEKHILYLGQLDTRGKGLDILLKAYRQAEVDTPLKIAGNGKDGAALKRLASEMRIGHKVSFTGWVCGKEKIDTIKEALFVCLPSKTEGWPLVINEAAAMGKPAVGSRVVGISEAIIHEKTGLLFEQGNTQDLTRAIRLLSTDAAYRRWLGGNAKARARSFTWDRSAQQREAYFCSIRQPG